MNRMGNTEARELEDLDSILRAPEIEITELDVMREALAVLVEEEEVGQLRSHNTISYAFSLLSTSKCRGKRQS